MSVVVPVWNPGPDFDRCLRSLLRQSLPADRYEIIFVDDGSTDGTAERLDELAAQHEQIKVIHIPNSGWPGKPRNIGIAHARGEYIQFVDNDDSLAPEALERLVAFGRANDSDIVIGKVTSDFRPTHHPVFRVNRPRCTMLDAPIVNILTPHKMFRRELMERHPELRYPEGKRRLEDQLFVMKAYFLAKNISVLSDYTCYYYNRRTSGKNAGSNLIEPEGFYGNLREVLDVIDTYAPSQAERDRIAVRFLRSDVLARLGDRLPDRKPDYRDRLFREIRSVMAERFDPSIDAKLPPMVRVRAALGREGRLDDLMEYAKRTRGYRAAAHVERWDWADGRLRVRAVLRLVSAEGKPLPLVRRDGEVYLSTELTGPDVPLAARHVDLENPEELADIVIKRRRTGDLYFVPSTSKAELTGAGTDAEGERVHVTYIVDGELDAATAQAGRPLGRGIWDVLGRLQVLGWASQKALGGDRGPGAGTPRGVVRIGDLRLQPYLTEGGGSLAIAAESPHASLKTRAARALRNVPPDTRTRVRTLARRMTGRTPAKKG
ncbi:glycosyltransferase family 2 protein [Luedemannella helvata]|uniref:glycosyltransferase family 2 protein n=1 Tax=Luedemannella helvata TaxID=349315 RepID=UPI0031D11309